MYLHTLTSATPSKTTRGMLGAKTAILGRGKTLENLMLLKGSRLAYHNDGNIPTIYHEGVAVLDYQSQSQTNT